jgi:hypothetical protein
LRQSIHAANDGVSLWAAGLRLVPRPDLALGPGRVNLRPGFMRVRRSRSGEPTALLCAADHSLFQFAATAKHSKAAGGSTTAALPCPPYVPDRNWQRAGVEPGEPRIPCTGLGGMPRHRPGKHSRRIGAFTLLFGQRNVRGNERVLVARQKIFAQNERARLTGALLRPAIDREDAD